MFLYDLCTIFLVEIFSDTLFTALATKCRLLTGAILAHELMHGWLRLKGTKPLFWFLLMIFQCAMLLKKFPFSFAEPMQATAILILK